MRSITTCLFANSFLFITSLLILSGHAEDKFKQASTDEQTLQQKEIARLIDTIDNDVDELHANFSPSVRKLIRIGLPALEPLLEKMGTVEPGHGLRVRSAIGGIIGMDIYDYKEVKEFWQSVGELDYHASIEERKKVIKNIHDWYKKRDAK